MGDPAVGVAEFSGREKTISAYSQNIQTLIEYVVERTMSDNKHEEALTPVELEGKLLAQEHRLFHILRNWLTRKEFPDGDPRRAACTDALLWRMVIALTPALAITGGGLIGA